MQRCVIFKEMCWCPFGKVTNILRSGMMIYMVCDFKIMIPFINYIFFITGEGQVSTDARFLSWQSKLMCAKTTITMHHFKNVQEFII